MNAARVVRPPRWNPRVFQGCAITYIVALHLVTWLSQGIALTKDAPGYLDGIAKLASGEAAYFPPGYSIFLWPWIALFPDSAGFAVTGVQHLFIVLSLLALQGVARPFLGPSLATCSLILAGSLGPTLFLPQGIFSENIALFGMSGALWLVARGGAPRPRAMEVAAAALVAWATLARMVPGPAMILPLLFVQLSTRGVRAAAFRTVRIVAMALAGVAAVAAWTFVNTGSFALSNGQGLHLYNRVVTEQGLLDHQGPATQSLRTRLGDRPLRVPHWDISTTLLADGLSYLEIAGLLGEVAVEGLRTDAPAFVAYSFPLAWRNYRAAPTLQIEDSSDQALPAFKRSPPSSWRRFSSRWWLLFVSAFVILWPILSWAPVLGLVMLPLLRDRWRFAAVFAVPAGYLWATAHVEYFLDRYIVCVLPFALVLVLAPVAAAMNAWQSWRRPHGARERAAETAERLDC